MKEMYINEINRLDREVAALQSALEEALSLLGEEPEASETVDSEW